MSADNGIYILPVKKKNGNIVYRVGYAAAIDNLDYYINLDDRSELEKYIEDIWPASSGEFITKDDAYIAARNKEKTLPYTEY